MRWVRAAIAVASLIGPLVCGSATALADDGLATRLTVRTDQITVNGEPVIVHARLTDAGGAPIAGQLLRLVVPVRFMGATRNEIAGEGTTDETGRATIRFAPSRTGSMTASVTFWGGGGYAPAEAPLTFDVVRPVVGYEPAPVGLQAPWARAALIPLPFIAVWLTYLFVLRLVVRVRRAGAGSSPPARAADA